MGGYQKVKMFEVVWLYSFWYNTRTWRTETDRQTRNYGTGRSMHSVARLCDWLQQLWARTIYELSL